MKAIIPSSSRFCGGSDQDRPVNHEKAKSEEWFNADSTSTSDAITTPAGALAHLQIGRAYDMQGNTAKAKAAYQDFLTLWKDADPDIPIFIAAKAEYAKLQ
jgi:hypothetical protein